MSRTRGGSQTECIIDEAGLGPAMASIALDLKQPPPYVSLLNTGLHSRLIDQWRPLFPQIVFDTNAPLLPNRIEQLRGALRPDIVSRTEWDSNSQKYGWWMPAVFPLEDEFYVDIRGGMRVARPVREVEERISDVYEHGLLIGRFLLGEINWPIKSPALTAYCHAFVWVQQ